MSVSVDALFKEFNLKYSKPHKWKEKLDAKIVYQILTQGDRLELTRDRLVQFLLNFDNIDVHSIEEKDIYTFEDLMQMNFDDQITNDNLIIKRTKNKCRKFVRILIIRLTKFPAMRICFVHLLLRIVILSAR